MGHFLGIKEAVKSSTYRLPPPSPCERQMRRLRKGGNGPLEGRRSFTLRGGAEEPPSIQRVSTAGAELATAGAEEAWFGGKVPITNTGTRIREGGKRAEFHVTRQKGGVSPEPPSGGLGSRRGEMWEEERQRGTKSAADEERGGDSVPGMVGGAGGGASAASGEAESASRESERWRKRRPRKVSRST